MTRFTRRLALTLIVGGGAVASAQRPLTRPSPPVSAPAVGPWANKFFMPGIDKEPSQQPPLVIAHDFGTVPYGTLCTQKFTITNIYDVPIQVTDIRVECGCLKAYHSNPPKPDCSLTISFMERVPDNMKTDTMARPAESS